MTKEELEKLRQDYSKHLLNKSDVDKNPFNQFNNWLTEAVSLQVPEPTAMTLATVDTENKPHARIVLLKGFSEEGFVFYSNYNSDKGNQLEQNAHAALCFFWIELERQVRVEGGVEKLSRAESEKYFRSRPHKSQLGALASNQSKEVENREALEKSFLELSRQYKEGEVPIPEWWGGYILKPTSIEFWQGRQSRLHDRIKYILENENWVIKRLSP